MKKSFNEGKWTSTIDVRDFIQKNYTPYDGDDSFLAGPTSKTLKLWGKVKELMKEERERGGIWDIDTHTISTITSHKPGYIEKTLKKSSAFRQMSHLKEQ